MARHDEDDLGGSLGGGRSPALMGFLTLVGAIAGGVILIALGHEFLGIILAVCGLPAALVVWMTVD
jgi:hypothetical protein